MSFIESNPTLINSKYAEILCHRFQVLVIPDAPPGHKNTTLIFCWSNFSFDLLWHRFTHSSCSVTRYIFPPAFHHFAPISGLMTGDSDHCPSIASQRSSIGLMSGLNMRILALAPWNIPVLLRRKYPLMELPGHSIFSVSRSFFGHITCQPKQGMQPQVRAAQSARGNTWSASLLTHITLERGKPGLIRPHDLLPFLRSQIF